MLDSVFKVAAIPALLESLIDSPLHFILNTENTPWCGGEYLIYTLEAEADARRLCVRTPKKPHGPSISLQLRQEAEIRSRVDTACINLFQPLIASDLSADNLLNTPYLVLGWADGSPLRWSDTIPPDEGTRRKVLHAVANASIDLLRVYESGAISDNSLMDDDANNFLRTYGTRLDHTQDRSENSPSSS